MNGLKNGYRVKSPEKWLLSLKRLLILWF